MSEIKITPLKPLQKSVKLSEDERLTWLCNFFLQHPFSTQLRLYPHLKQEVKTALTRKGYKI